MNSADNFKSHFDCTIESLNLTAKTLERLRDQQQSQREMTTAELHELLTVAREHARMARQQQETIKRLVSVTAQQQESVKEFVSVVTKQTRAIVAMCSSTADTANASSTQQ